MLSHLGWQAVGTIGYRHGFLVVGWSVVLVVVVFGTQLFSSLGEKHVTSPSHFLAQTPGGKSHITCVSGSQNLKIVL